jgi:hypothetical protein
MFNMTQVLSLWAFRLSRILSEAAAEPPCDAAWAIKLLDTLRWFEARPRWTKVLQVRVTCDKGTPYG